jgi:hypothetical protein
MKPKKPENETPKQQFKRIVEPSVKAILQKLDTLGKCSNKRLYSYSQEDIDKIFSTINKKIRQVKLKLDVYKQEDFEL